MVPLAMIDEGSRFSPISARVRRERKKKKK
jgi:hypothetical protein